MIKGILKRLVLIQILCFSIVLSFPCIAVELQMNANEADEWAKKILEGMPLEKKVAQLICTDISGNYVPEDDPRFKDWIRFAGEYGIGGFVIYGGTPYNVARLLNLLQNEAEIPLLISADFEGGPGQQVAGASEFPANMAFAATGDEELMYEAAKIMAEEGRTMGIHLTYTPVTDVSVSPENSQESVRSFGGDIDLMARLLKAYVKGYHEMGMFTTSKHFPGRGDMKALNDYSGFNYLDKSEKEYRQNEQRAFQYAVDAGVDFIMTEHIAVPSLTGGSKLPASVEPKLVNDVIREGLGFQGIITTDDLWYEHVCARFGAEEVALKALEAGHDILLKPKDPIAVIEAVVRGVEDGRISEKQIDRSVFKLLVKKAELGLHKERLVNVNEIGEKVGTVEHYKVVQKVADRSVTMLRNEGIFPMKKWNPNQTVHITFQKIHDQPSVSKLNTKMSLAFNGITNFALKPEINDTFYEQVIKAVEQSELVILSFFVQRDRYGKTAPLQEKDLDLIKQIIELKPGKVIAMSYGNPHVIKEIENVSSFFVGYGEGGWYGNQEVYFDSFIKIMKNELSPSGKLPLMLNTQYSIGFGLTY